MRRRALGRPDSTRATYKMDTVASTRSDDYVWSHDYVQDRSHPIRGLWQTRPRRTKHLNPSITPASGHSLIWFFFFFFFLKKNYFDKRQSTKHVFHAIPPVIQIYCRNCHSKAEVLFLSRKMSVADVVRCESEILPWKRLRTARCELKVWSIRQEKKGLVWMFVSWKGPKISGSVKWT